MPWRFLRRVPAIALAAMAAVCSPPAPEPLTLATTTSVANSGLLDVLAAAFEREHRIPVRSHLVGSGRALALLARGDADVVISHAPEAEARALREHPRWRYRKIMFNDFVIAGPREDPAAVAHAADAIDAMRRIAASGARFLSRGDSSGTHERENELWRLAGTRPGPDRLVVAGAGMGTTLRIASETDAYTLTDRATFAQQAAVLRLVLLHEGDPKLLNTYAVIVGPDAARAADARTFAAWLAEGNGRNLIATYRVSGRVQAFQPWPAGAPARAPDALPR